MPPDSVPDILHFVQPPDLSYRPIRAALAGELEANDAADCTTDLCLVLACLADGNHGKWIEALWTPANGRDMLRDLAKAHDMYSAEIQAIRALTDILTAAGLALGFPADVVKQRIIDKKRRELFEFPQ